MIGGIESLQPELQVPALGEVEILQRGEIPTGDARAVDHVAADVPESPGGRQRESLDVEPLAGCGVVEPGADTGGVRPVVANRGVGPVSAGGDVLREPAREA